MSWCRDKLANGRARAIVINSGNANAFTGRAGETAVQVVARETAKRLGCRVGDVLMASTGVIGEDFTRGACGRGLRPLGGRARR